MNIARPLFVVAAVLAVVATGLLLTNGRDSTDEPLETAGTVDSPVMALVRADAAVRQPIGPQSRREVLTPPDARIAIEVAVRLAGIGVREAGTHADEIARTLVAEELRDAGWETAEDVVGLPQGGQTANVVAWRGVERPTGRHLVIGAHHDTVPGSPGANDNASGIGVLVALAHLLAEEDLPVPVVLVAFGAEERQPTGDHHIGSESYASAHAESVTAMVSVDMVGNTTARGDHCACWFRDGDRSLADRLVEIGAETGVPVSATALGAVSDHVPFARRGVPSALLWSGPDPRYHSPRDTAEHLRIDDLRRAGSLVAVFVRSGG